MVSLTFVNWHEFLDRQDFVIHLVFLLVVWQLQVEIDLLVSSDKIYVELLKKSLQQRKVILIALHVRVNLLHDLLRLSLVELLPPLEELDEAISLV